MKQFITFLCAVMIIFGASSTASAAHKQLKDSYVKEQLRNAKNAKKTLLGKKLRSTDKVNVKGHSTSKALKAQSTNVEIAYYAATFDANDNSIFYGLQTEDWSQAFFFSIFLEEGKHDIELGKEYTLADMDASYSEWDDEDSNAHYYTSVSFTKTVGAGYDVTINAEVTDEDGNTFVLHYAEEPIVVTGETIKVDIKNPISNVDRISDGTWRLLASDDSYTVQINYFSANEESPAGTFSATDFDFANTYIYVYTGELDEYDDPVYVSLKCKDGSATVTDDGSRIDVSASLLASDGNVYDVIMSYVKPHAETFVTITADNMTIDDWNFDWWGEVSLNASDENYSVRLNINPEGLGEGMAGTYTIGNGGCSGYISPIEGEGYDIYSGSFEITYDKGDIIVDGKVLCPNNVEYTLNLKYIKPVATRQESITFDNVELGILNFAWQAIGYNADSTKFISIGVQNWDVAGSYTEKDLMAEYSYVVTDINGEEGKKYNVILASIDVTYDEENKTAVITGTLLCKGEDDESDMPEFTINVTAVEPDPYERDQEVAFEANIAEYTVNKEYIDQGAIYVDARDGEKVVALEVWVPEGATELVAGTYPINSTYGPQTVATSDGMSFDGSLYYSFAGYANDQNQFYAIWFIVSGEVIISENGKIEVNALNSKGQKVHCVLGDIHDGINQVENSDSNIIKRIIDGRLIIERNGVRYNALGAIEK